MIGLPVVWQGCCRARLTAPLLLLIVYGGVYPVQHGLAQEEGSPAAAESIPASPAVRRFFFPNKQAAKLVPEGFRPVEAEQLESRVSVRADAIDATQPVLQRATYIATLRDGTLRSGHSVLEFVAHSDANALVRLGACNLALLDAVTGDADEEAARLATTPDGTLIALTRGQNAVSFQWGIASQESQIAGVAEFRLQLPPAPISRMLVQLPPQIEMTVDRGAISRFQVSEEAEPGLQKRIDEHLATLGGVGSDAFEDWQWWLVDLGGLSEVRLETHDPTTAEGERRFRCTGWDTDYRVSEAEITFNTRLQIVADEESPLPQIRIPREAHLLSLRVNGRTVDWVEQFVDEQWKRVRPRGGETIADGNASIVVQGLVPNQPGTVLQLPRVEIPESTMELMTATTDLRLQIDPGITLADLKLPDGWRHRYAAASDAGESLPPMIRLFGPPSKEAIEAIFVRDQQMAHGNAVNHLRIDDQHVRAELTIDLNLAKPQVLPLQFQLQNQWAITEVVSNKQPSTAAGFDYRLSSQQLQVWPRDPSAEKLRLVVRGERPLESQGPIWFLRSRDVRMDVYYAVSAPQDLTLQLSEHDRISTTIRQLPEAVGDLVTTTSADTQYFKVPRGGSLGPIDVQKRSTDVSVQSTTVIQLVEDALEQRFVLKINRPTADRTTLRINVGDNLEAPVTWNAFQRGREPSGDPTGDESGEGSKSDSPAARRTDDPLLPVRAERSESGEQSEWAVTVPESVGVQFTLVGVRRFPLEDLTAVSAEEPVHYALGLPVVLDTRDADSEIQLHEDLLVAAESLEAGIEQLRSQRVPDDFVLLRYQPRRHNSFRFLRRGALPNQCTYAKAHRITHFLTATNTDRVESEIALIGSGPIQISYPGAFSFVRLTIDGEAVGDETVDESRGVITIPAGAKKRTIRVEWQRFHKDQQLLRRWKPVGITLDVPALHTATDYQLLDGWQVIWPLAFRFQHEMPIERTGLVLLRPASAICFAIVFAMLSGMLGWRCAYSPRLTRSCTVLLTGAGLALSGVVGLALLAMGIAMTTGALLRHLDRRLKESAEEARPVREPSSIYSRPGATLLLALAAALGFSAMTAAGQGAITVLIPVDGTGERVGSKVYISESVFRQLFSALPGDASRTRHVVLAAEHRVQLAPFEANVATDSTLVRSHYTIETFAAETDVTLKLDPQRVRSVRIDNFQEGGIARWSRLEESVRLYALPRGNWQVSVDTVADVEAIADQSRFVVRGSILPCHRSEVEVSFAAGLVNPPQISGRGPEVVGEASRMVSRHLGAIASLEMTWREESDAPEETAVRVAQWNRFGARDKIEELQLIHAEGRGRNEQTITVRINKQQRPKLLSSDWRLVRWESISQDLTQAVLAPIRPTTQRPTLAWWSPIDAETSRTSVSPLAVLEPGGTPLQQSYFAVSHSGFWEIDAVTGLQRVESDEFYAAWTGIRKDVSVAFQPAGTERSIILSRNDVRPTEIDEQQQYAATPTVDTLSYHADIYPGENDLPSLAIALPDEMVVTEVRVDGSEVYDQIQTIPGHRVLVLDGLAPYEPMELTIEGHFGQTSSGTRQLPRVAPLDGVVLQSIYEVRRDPRIQLAGLQNTQLPEEITVEPAEASSQSQLREFLVPVARWRLGQLSPADSDLPLTVEKNRLPERAVATLASSLIWDSNNAEWYSETVIRLRGKNVPELLTVDVPYDWAADPKSSVEAMLLGPADANRSRPIRLKLAGDPGDDSQRVVLRLRRSGADPAQIAAPLVRLFGVRTAQRFFVLPSELTTRQLNWNTQGMQVVAFDRIASLVHELDLQTPAAPIVFVSGQNEYVPTLTSDPGEISAQPYAAICDARLFENRTDQRWALLRWDIQPSNRHAFQLRLPPQCHVECMWSAGRQAAWRVDGDIVTVQLNLSQLAERVRMLMRIDGRPAEWIPQLLNDEPQMTTVAVLEPAGTPAAARVMASPVDWMPISETTWRALRGHAILELLKNSSDGAASRARPEIVGWLGPWEARFRAAIRESGEDGIPLDESLNDRLTALHSQMETFLTRFDEQRLAEPATEVAEAGDTAWAIASLYRNQNSTSRLAVSPPSNSRMITTGILLGGILICLLYWLGMRLRETKNETLAAAIMAGAICLLALPVVPWQLFAIPAIAVFAILTVNNFWSRLRFG